MSMSRPANESLAEAWNPTAALAAWLVPGLGHYLLGQRKRGVILCVSIGLLWLGGVLIGGVSALDRQEHRYWFLGQMLVAPSVAVSYYQGHLKTYAGAHLPGPQNQYQPSYGRANEQGVLYTALAGLLNLLAIIDVLYRDPRQLAAVDAGHTRVGGA